MKPVAPLDAKKTLRSRMTRASKRFEQPKVTSAFDQFLSKAFDSSHLSTDLADFGAVLDSRRVSSSNEDELRMTTSQLESSIWDALGGSSGGGALEASVCAPDHSLRRALIKQDAEDANVKLNKALSSLERCSFLYDEHVFDVTKPLHLKKDAGPRSLGELAQLRSAVHGVSAAMTSSSPARSGATAVAAKRTVRRKSVPKYDAAELADDESSSGGSSIFDETESARSSMQSQRTSFDSSSHHATRPAFKHQAVSLPTHLSQVPSLASTPLRVMEVDVPLHEQGNDDADQGINDEMLAAITYANLPRTHPLRRDSIVIPQPVVRPPRRPVPALVIAEEKEDEEEPASLASVGRSTSAPQLPCIAELGGSPTLPERTVKPAPLVLAPTLPPIAVDAELAGSVVSPLSAAVTAAANISMVQLQQRDEPIVKPLSASVSAPCTPRDPRAVARRDAAESVLWRPDTARASTATTLRGKRSSPPPRLPRSRKRPTTVDMGVPLKGLGPTSIDVEALQALLRDAEATHPEDVEITVEEGEEVQVLPCFAAGEGWSLMSHVHQVGEVTPRASRAPLEHIEFMDGLTPRVGDFQMAQPMPASSGLKRTHLELQHKPAFGFARQRSDSMSSAASLLSDAESGFSSDVPSLTSDTSSGAGYESDSSATSFSTASSGGGDEYALSSKGKGKVASQYKPGSRPPVVRSSILPYIKSSSPVARVASRRSGSLPSLVPRDSVEMHQQATTVLHRRQLSTDGDRTTVLWELRLPLQHIANVEQQQQQMQLANKKSRHVRERHATLAGQECFENPLYHHWDQSAKAE